MADIEVGFVNVCEKFGIRALNDYQREAITPFVYSIKLGYIITSASRIKFNSNTSENFW